MITREQLKCGLEWISGKTRITVLLEDSIEVTLYPEYPLVKPHITLALGVWHNQVEVYDLSGNGHGTELQDCGYGSQIINIGIQAMNAYFGIMYGSEASEDIYVYGDVSARGDPSSRSEKIACRNRRSKFWRRTGFNLKDPNAYHTHMSASLSNLTLRKDKLTNNGTPVFIDLNNFWVIGERPTVFTEDLVSLKSINLEQFNLADCPQSCDIELELCKAMTHSRNFFLITCLCLSSVNGYLSFTYLELIDAITTSILGIILIPIFLYYIDKALWRSLPSFKRYTYLQEKRGSIVRRTKDYIYNLEKSHNGFVWRLQNLIPIEKASNISKLDNLLKASKEQNFSSVSQNFTEYEYLIKQAKESLNNPDSIHYE